MNLMDTLSDIWTDRLEPLIQGNNFSISFKELMDVTVTDLSEIKQGDVVALIGDFDPISIKTLLTLIDRRTVIVPLTTATESEHEYFFKTANVKFIIQNNDIKERTTDDEHILVEGLRRNKHAGLVLFSTGTTGRPKAILHDMTLFLKRFLTPRPTLRTMSFLLFDHIGGINTLFHTLFNRGTVIVPQSRTIESVLNSCKLFNVEVLPTTPTFLRLLMISGMVPQSIPDCVKIITYGTEKMDESTLESLCTLLPNVDFRQTFGMSELGIVRVKSKARNSLFIKIGGEGIETKIVDGILYIRSRSPMLGYLNAESPFDKEGWYNTGDLVELDGEYLKIVGRVNDVINVGGLKFLASQVEAVVYSFHGVALAKVVGKANPITGQHVELTVQFKDANKVDITEFNSYLRKSLQPHMVPLRTRVTNVNVGHRFKKL